MDSAAQARPIIEFISFSVAGIRSLNGEVHTAGMEIDEEEDEHKEEEEEDVEMPSPPPLWER